MPAYAVALNSPLCLVLDCLVGVWAAFCTAKLLQAVVESLLVWSSSQFFPPPQSHHQESFDQNAIDWGWRIRMEESAAFFYHSAQCLLQLPLCQVVLSIDWLLFLPFFRLWLCVCECLLEMLSDSLLYLRLSLAASLLSRHCWHTAHTASPKTAKRPFNWTFNSPWFGGSLVHLSAAAAAAATDSWWAPNSNAQAKSAALF